MTYRPDPRPDWKCANCGAMNPAFVNWMCLDCSLSPKDAAERVAERRRKELGLPEPVASGRLF